MYVSVTFCLSLGGTNRGRQTFSTHRWEETFLHMGGNIFTHGGQKFSVSGGGGDCDVDGHELKLKKFKNSKRLVGTGNSSQL